MSDLDELDKKISDARGKQAPPQKDDFHAQGMRAGYELVIPIILGALGGYWLDQWLETTPAFFLSLFFLGLITGFYNVYKFLHKGDQTVGFSRLPEEKKDANTLSEKDTTNN